MLRSSLDATKQSRILQLAWPPPELDRAGLLGPGFLEGQEGHERAWLFLEGVGAWCCLGLCLPVDRAAPGVGSDEGNSHRDAGGLRPLG